ncbi:hypothetical protein RhiirB3_532466 [Rhizophagus irregularis]|nr:hypothetical protein RhiirB3_532466 [Rhizophagus irregularis]
METFSVFRVFLDVGLAVFESLLMQFSSLSGREVPEFFLMWDTSVFLTWILMGWVINALETDVWELGESAISKIHEQIDTFSIGNHLNIVKAMQAIRIDNPPASKSDDAIDIIP